MTKEPQQGADEALALEELAYRNIREALMTGLFEPGDRLSIRKVAAALNTSPMPARTALSRLASEQALDVLPSGTAVVPRLTRAAFIEMSAIRAQLEPLAVRMAGPRLTKATLKVLSETVELHRAARERSDPAATLQADRDFLFTLYTLADAPMLLSFIEAMWLRRGPVFWEARWVLLGQPAAPNQHEAMLAALKSRKVEAAAALLRMEIEEATAFLLGQLHFAGEPPQAGGLSSLAPVRRRSGAR